MPHIYTDGSCLSNPNGPGGWAFCFIEDDGFLLCNSGSEKSTTNNRMELKAIIESLKFINNSDEYKIFTDSQLCINCATGKWKRNKNLDLWKEYDNQIKNKNIKFHWVKGHNGNKYNELVDKIAYDEAKKNIKNIY
jgi:ribonuclease HI